MSVAALLLFAASVAALAPIPIDMYESETAYTGIELFMLAPQPDDCMFLDFALASRVPESGSLTLSNRHRWNLTILITTPQVQFLSYTHMEPFYSKYYPLLFLGLLPENVLEALFTLPLPLPMNVSVTVTQVGYSRNGVADQGHWTFTLPTVPLVYQNQGMRPETKPALGRCGCCWL